MLGQEDSKTAFWNQLPLHRMQHFAFELPAMLAMPCCSSTVFFTRCSLLQHTLQKACWFLGSVGFLQLTVLIRIALLNIKI